MSDFAILAALHALALTAIAVRLRIDHHRNRALDRSMIDRLERDDYPNHRTVRVRIVGSEWVALGTAKNHTIVFAVRSHGFALRTESGDVVDVPEGTDILYFGQTMTDKGLLFAPAGETLLASLEPVEAAGEGALRRHEAYLRAPPTLVIADPQRPLRVFSRAIRYSRVAGLVATSAVLLDACYLSPRFNAAALFAGLAIFALTLGSAKSVLNTLLHTLLTRPT